MSVENRLAHPNGFEDTAKILTDTRYFVAWEAIGHAVACYEAALTYARERLIRRALGELPAHPEQAWRYARRDHQHVAHMSEVEPAPRCGQDDAGDDLARQDGQRRKARRVCADARDILGGNGILLDYHGARHHTDVEVVYTYEGTDTIQSLIVGREITGVQAFTSSRS